VKKAARWLVVAVVVVFVIQNPAGAAMLARRAMAGVSHAAHSLSSFASDLG